MTPEDLDTLADKVAGRLRVELAAIQLGDDMLLDEAEAAQLLGVHPDTLGRMRRAGEVGCVFVGRYPRYSLGMIRRIARAEVDGRRRAA